jgi:8-oxo-dGTP pyrophosphatase MutT (NUDIX family)
MTTLRTSLSLIDSAVLAPAYRDPRGDVRLVFIRRSPHGIHGGQIAFPGGRREASDASLLQTALREAHEEIGLDPAHVQVLAELPAVDTVATGYRIAPFLARLEGPPPTWKRQETEIEEILEVRLDELADSALHGVEMWQLPGWREPREIPFFRMGGYKLWGATYKIVQPLVPRLVANEWPI